MIPDTLTTARIASLIASHIEIAAPLASLLASWFLYGVLGKRYLGADDDFVEVIRAKLIPILGRLLPTASNLYVETSVRKAEYAGYTTAPVDEVERRLQSAGFLRQPLASIHRRDSGDIEDGSWARPRGPLVSVDELVSILPAVGGYLGRFVRSLDVVLAMRQTHVMLFEATREDGSRTVHIYCHDEPNPVNPLTAVAHYRARGFRAAPNMARRALQKEGITLRRPVDGQQPE